MYRALLVILIFFCANNVFATASGPAYFCVRNVKKDDVLNIREKPNAKSRIIGTIPYNAEGIQNAGGRWPQWEADMSPTEELLKDRNDLTKEEKEKLLKGERWQKVRYNNVEGWVNGKYVHEDASPF